MGTSVALRNLPLIGSQVSKIGAVYDIVATPCDTEPLIWVLAFWHELPQMVWSIVKPDWNDAIIDRFGRHHHRRRRQRFHVDDIMKPKFQIPKGTLSWVAFGGVELLERIGWYFCLIDATTDFLVNWTSLVYQYSGCETPGNPFNDKYLDGQPFSMPASGSRLMNIWQPGGQFIMGGTPTYVIPNTKRPLSVMASVSSAPWGTITPIGNISGLEIINYQTNEVIASATGAETSPNHWQVSTGDLSHTRHDDPLGHRYWPAVRVSGKPGFMTLPDGLFRVWATYGQNLLWDP